MANRHRGEIEAELSGETYVLCLTLGALAELEDAYGGADLIALAERFETGRIGASDAIRIVGAGLRGAGNDVADTDVARMTIAGGAAGFLSLVARLLTATFASAETPSGNA
jgi:Phage tail tube protein, GTA-gp10